MEKVILILALLVGLLGCSANDDRLHDLQRDLNDGISKLSQGRVVEVKLPSLTEHERLVFINGRYIGGVCDSGDLEGGVRQELDLRFGASEGRAAFAVLVLEDRVLDSVPFDEPFFFLESARKGLSQECALIATKENSMLRIYCENESDGSLACRPLLGLDR